jgi:hypothetical protein
MPRHFGSRRAAAALMVFSLAASPLAGCAPGQGNIALGVDASDPCGQQRADFSQSKTYFTDQIVAGATTGGVLGAVGGALIGGASGGSRGALIGALAGGAAGAVAGGASAYYSTMADRYADQATLARSINNDLDREAAQMDHVNAAFARLRECRFTVAQQTKAAVRMGQMPRAAAVATLDYQRQLFAQEIEVARAYGVNMQKRDDEFRVAAEQVQKSDPAYAPPRPRAPALTPAQQVVASATETIPEKRRSFSASVDDAARRSQTAFNIDAAGAS